MGSGAGTSYASKAPSKPLPHSTLSSPVAETLPVDDALAVADWLAELLGVDTGPIEQMASVRFTGMIREEAGATAQPFDEVWNFTRPIGSQGGWVLAGIQQVSAA